MGKIYAFQSPIHGQCGTTATMVAAAYALQKKGCSVCLVHSQSSYADLENLFYSKETNGDTFFDGIGLDGLCYSIKAQELNRKDFDRAMIQLDDNLFLLPSVAKVLDEERKSIVRYILTEKLPLFYDYVFVDTGADKSEMGASIREVADVSVCVITQSRTALKEEYLPQISENTILLCGNYNDERKLNLKALSKRLKNLPVFAVPYCTEYADAIANSTVKQFFLSYENLLKPEKTKGRGLNAIRQRLAPPKEETLNFFEKLPELNHAFVPDRKMKSEKKEFA